MDIQITKEAKRKPHKTNILYDVVEWSRSRQILNEEQACAVLLIGITGLLPSDKDNTAGVVRGGSSGGKTHMMDEVVKPLFALTKNDDGTGTWIYSTTGGSDKSFIDDPNWNISKIAYLNEINKMPEPLLEFMKGIFGDDGGNTYKRNVPDPDSESTRTTVDVSNKSMPYTFMLADENAMKLDAELATRLMDIKVDETPEKNEGVHDMHWGHKNLKVRGVTNNYIFDAPDLRFMLQKHIAEIPVNTPVVIPTGDGRFAGDNWNAAEITKPMFLFKRSQSSRASRTIASLTKASALLNHHARDRVMLENDEGEMVEHIVVSRTDIANIIAMRKTLINITHGLDEKKLGIIDAILTVGGPANAAGTAMQAPLKAIEEYMHKSDTISGIKKSEVEKLLDEMDEMYLIDKVQNPDNHTEYLYVYKGMDSIKPPALDAGFDGISDPILDVSIQDTIKAQQERLGASDPRDLVNDSTNIEKPTDEALSALESKVYEAMQSNVAGIKVRNSDLSAVDNEHLVGAIPFELDGEYSVPVESYSRDDYDGSLFDPDNDVWESNITRSQIRNRIEKAIDSLQKKGKWQLDTDGDDFVVVVS